MINTILFDLDGTLLQFSQDEFIEDYLGKLKKVFRSRGLDAEKSLTAMWVGIKDMVLNDGSMTNAERFWITFAHELSLSEEQCRVIEAACDDFYVHEFDTVKSVLTPNDISERLVRALPKKGYQVVLATNPFFPSCAVTTRLGWIGLTQEDFSLVTHYTNSSYCKPNLKYFEEVFTKIERRPEQCLMVGNNSFEDMAAGKAGAETFLVTDFMENEADLDISDLRQGTLAELEEYLMSLPDISK